MNKTLLVVDDALIIRHQIIDAASAAGWTIVGQADNGQKAYELYKQLRPAMMTLDMVMPEFNGMHALEKILPEFPDAKIVLVSALSQKEILKKAFQIGATDFVIKPFRPAALIATLESALGAVATVG